MIHRHHLLLPTACHGGSLLRLERTTTEESADLAPTWLCPGIQCGEHRGRCERPAPEQSAPDASIVSQTTGCLTGDRDMAQVQNGSHLEVANTVSFTSPRIRLNLGKTSLPTVP
jgi:hypothetical protein